MEIVWMGTDVTVRVKLSQGGNVMDNNLHYVVVYHVVYMVNHSLRQIHMEDVVEDCFLKKFLQMMNTLLFVIILLLMCLYVMRTLQLLVGICNGPGIRLLRLFYLVYVQNVH